MYKGWITAYPDEDEILEDIGIILGEYNIENLCYENCEVSIEAMENLDSYWLNPFIWGLDWVGENKKTRRI